MNWHAMLLMTGILGACVLVALLGVWLIDKRNVDPIFVVLGIFILAVLASGALAK